MPQYSVPYPERHPFCEFTVNLDGGSGVQFIGGEKISASPESVMLLGPGVPHYGEVLKYPSRSVTIYFLPILLFDSGPMEDGARILNRFTDEQTIQRRLVKMPPPLWKLMKRDALLMLKEFRQADFGSHCRLRSLLLDMLVALMRWEKINKKEDVRTNAKHWEHIQKPLSYIQENYSEPLYIKQIAQVSGVSVSRLKILFRESLGMSCIQYIKAYRISLAAAKLGSSKDSITEIAFSVGYETLSNFNTTFRDIMGMSPTKYIASIRKASGHPVEMKPE